MLIVGLLSNVDEAKEVEYVARVFSISCRIRKIAKKK